MEDNKVLEEREFIIHIGEMLVNAQIEYIKNTGKDASSNFYIDIDNIVTEIIEHGRQTNSVPTSR